MTTEEIVWEEIDKVRKENIAITELWKNQIAANLKLNKELNELNQLMVYCKQKYEGMKQRCEAAEGVLEIAMKHCQIHATEEIAEPYFKWQSLKQKQEK